MDLFKLKTNDELKPKCVIKLTTSMWHDDRGVHIKRDINFLKRKCTGFNIIAEDCQNIGAEEVIPRIINLDSCTDGVYEIIICNGRRDWETNAVEDYDYELIPEDE